MPGLVVATPSEAFAARLTEAFAGATTPPRRYWREGLGSGDPDAAVLELTRSDPQVVALGPAIETDEALRLLEAFDAQRPDVVVVLVAEPSVQLLERALRAGARDLVPPDAPVGDLHAAFTAALEAASRRRGALAAVDPTAPSRHVICVVAPKGGTGKTTVSTNLAAGLAQHAPGEVAIVDLDFQFGDVAAALRLTPEHTFADVPRTPLSVDATTVKVFLTPSPLGLFALCAPEDPVEADAITPEHVRQVLSLLAAEFRYVICDTGSGLDDPTLAALPLCTDIVTLTSTEVPSVRATRKEWDLLDQLGLDSQRRLFVINRADAKVGLPIDEIEATVGAPADVTIPSSRTVPIAVNQGEPVVGDRRSPAGAALARLVAKFLPESPSARAGLLRRPPQKVKEVA
jgi:pilus assembly protein CpaE